jgi:predicted DNA-binding protein
MAALSAKRPSVDGHRHYERGFLLRLPDRLRKFLEAQRERTGKDMSAQMREMIEKEMERSISQLRDAKKA